MRSSSVLFILAAAPPSNLSFTGLFFVAAASDTAAPVEESAASIEESAAPAEKKLRISRCFRFDSGVPLLGVGSCPPRPGLKGIYFLHTSPLTFEKS